jgi:hypothetical protein
MLCINNCEAMVVGLTSRGFYSKARTGPSCALCSGADSRRARCLRRPSMSTR